MLKTREIRRKVLEELPSLLPALKIGKVEEEKKISGNIFDVAAKIMTPKGKEWLLVCDIKWPVQPRTAREVSAQLRQKAKGLKMAYAALATTFLSKRTRDILKEEGIGYLDLAGNCYLKFDDVYIEKVVEKNPFTEKRSIKTVFSPVSSRILRVLLEEPKQKWKVLKLSQISNVSLGQTSNVCRKLVDEEYLKKDEEGFYFLTEPGKLLDEWQINYTYTQNKLVSYYSFEQNLEKLIKKVQQMGEADKLKYALTLRIGASLVAPFVRGVSNLEMYIPDTEALTKWVKLLDLRPAETGSNVSFFIPYDEGIFYKLQKISGINIVGNIQLYLDLYNYPARGREQAEFLRRKKIKF